MEDFPAQSPWSDGLYRLLHCADPQHESAIRILVLEHRRREVLHFGVTEHPTAAWTSQQMVEAFAYRDPAQYLIRDRDSVYGNDVRRRITTLGIEEVLTAPQSP